MSFCSGLKLNLRDLTKQKAALNEMASDLKPSIG